MGSFKNLYAKIKTKNIPNKTKSSFEIFEANVRKIVIKHHSLFENLKALKHSVKNNIKKEHEAERTNMRSRNQHVTLFPFSISNCKAF